MSRAVTAVGTPEDDARQEAEDAVRTLGDALRAAGIVLPSLWVDAQDVGGVVLVELGRARPDVVAKLAEVVARGAAT